MNQMKKAYMKPKAYKLDYTYEEQVMAISAVQSFWGGIGTIYENFGYCQMNVDENNFTTCAHYFTSSEVGNKCKTDQMPWSLRPW